MNASLLNLRAVPIPDLVTALVKTAEAVWSQTRAPKFQWVIQTSIGNLNALVGGSPDPTADAAFKQLLEWIKTREFVVCSQIQVTRIDQQTNQNELIRYDSANGIVASVAVEPRDNPLRKAQVVEALEKHLTFISPQNLAAASPGQTGDVLQFRQAAVGDLHAQLNKLGELLTTITERDVELRRKRMAELEDENRARVAEFEAERKRLQAQDEEQRTQRSAELDRQETDLKARVANFDTKESKFRRRDLQEKLNTLLDQFGTFKLSDGAVEKRTPVWIAVISMAVVFASIGAISGYNYFTTLNWHYLPLTSVGFVGFSATMLFVLKWSDQWFREHADEELQSKRYKADMLRASWIAELIAEWAKDGKEAPPEMLDVFARNLFQGGAEFGATEHPADAILDLLKRAQKLDVGKDRVSLEAANPK